MQLSSSLTATQSSATIPPSLHGERHQGHMTDPITRSISPSIKKRSPRTRQSSDSVVIGDYFVGPSNAVPAFDFSRVPKGPSKMVNRKFEPVGDDVKACPHLFISRNDIPPIVGAPTHLSNRFRDYRHFKEVQMDESGYYVVFEDSDRGERDLWQSYTNLNGRTHWTYVLKFEARQKGIARSQACRTSPRRRNGTLATADGAIPTNQANPFIKPEPDLEPEQPWKEIAELEPDERRTETWNGEEEQKLKPTVAQLEQSLTQHRTPGVAVSATVPSTSDGIPAPATSLPLRPEIVSSTPNRPHNRGDDELSQASGWTPSEISSSTSKMREPRCSYCKGTEARFTFWVRCTACRRNFHESCVDPRPPSLSDKDRSSLSTWRCYNCLRSGKQPSSAQSKRAAHSSAAEAGEDRRGSTNDYTYTERNEIEQSTWIGKTEPNDSGRDESELSSGPMSIDTIAPESPKHAATALMQPSLNSYSPARDPRKIKGGQAKQSSSLAISHHGRLGHPAASAGNSNTEVAKPSDQSTATSTKRTGTKTKSFPSCTACNRKLLGSTNKNDPICRACKDKQQSRPQEEIPETPEAALLNKREDAVSCAIQDASPVMTHGNTRANPEPGLPAFVKPTNLTRRKVSATQERKPIASTSVSQGVSEPPQTLEEPLESDKASASAAEAAASGGVAHAMLSKPMVQDPQSVTEDVNGCQHHKAPSEVLSESVPYGDSKANMPSLRQRPIKQEPQLGVDKSGLRLALSENEIKGKVKPSENVFASGNALPSSRTSKTSTKDTKPKSSGPKPDCTYEHLILFAFRAARDDGKDRLTASEIFDWVVGNVSGYSAGQQSLKAGVGAILSQKKDSVFVKLDRRPGQKGCDWAIKPGKERAEFKRLEALPQSGAAKSKSDKPGTGVRRMSAIKTSTSHVVDLDEPPRKRTKVGHGRNSESCNSTAYSIGQYIKYYPPSLSNDEVATAAVGMIQQAPPLQRNNTILKIQRWVSRAEALAMKCMPIVNWPRGASYVVFQQQELDEVRKQDVIGLISEREQKSLSMDFYVIRDSAGCRLRKRDIPHRQSRSEQVESIDLTGDSKPAILAYSTRSHRSHRDEPQPGRKLTLEEEIAAIVKDTVEDNIETASQNEASSHEQKSTQRSGRASLLATLNIMQDPEVQDGPPEQAITGGQESLGVAGVRNVAATAARPPVPPGPKGPTDTFPDDVTLLGLLERDYRARVNGPLERDLFKSQPEYHPDAVFWDRETKVQKIRARPSRKATFGKILAFARTHRFNPHHEIERLSRIRSAPYSARLDSSDDTSNLSPSKRPQVITSSPVKPQRHAKYFPEEDADMTDFRDSSKRKEYNSLAEMLEIPEHSIPILYEKQLAFRDGNLINGRLPRAKAIYKVGRNVAGQLK